MTLQQLKTQLEESIESGKLTLSPDLLQVDAFEDVLQLLNLPGLELPISISKDDLFIEPLPVNSRGIPVESGAPDADGDNTVETLKLSDAGAELFGANSDNFTVYIWDHEGGGFEIVVRATFTALELADLITLGLVDLNGIEIPGLNFLSFTLEGETLNKEIRLNADASEETIEIIPALGLNMEGPGFAFIRASESGSLLPKQLDLKGTVQVGESAITPSISIPLSTDAKWKLDIGENIADGIPLPDLFQLLGGANIFELLPSELELGEHFRLTVLDIDFDFSTTLPGVSSIQLAISLDQWVIIEDAVEINNTELLFHITDPFDRSRVIDTTISGNIHLGPAAPDGLDLGVEIVVPTGSRDWMVSARPDLDLSLT
jgi:hypothetical protein